MGERIEACHPGRMDQSDDEYSPQVRFPFVPSDFSDQLHLSRTFCVVLVFFIVLSAVFMSLTDCQPIGLVPVGGVRKPENYHWRADSRSGESGPPQKLQATGPFSTSLEETVTKCRHASQCLCVTLKKTKVIQWRQSRMHQIIWVLVEIFGKCSPCIQCPVEESKKQ